MANYGAKPATDPLDDMVLAASNKIGLTGAVKSLGARISPNRVYAPIDTVTQAPSTATPPQAGAVAPVPSAATPPPATSTPMSVDRATPATVAAGGAMGNAQWQADMASGGPNAAIDGKGVPQLGTGYIRNNSTGATQAVGSPSQPVAQNPADTAAYNQAMQERNANTYASNARQGQQAQQAQTPDPLSTRLGVLNALKTDVNNGEYNNIGAYKLALRGLNEQEGHATQLAGIGMQGANQLAVGQQSGEYGVLGKKMEIGSPLNAAHTSALGAQTKLYGAQQQEQEQKVQQQQQIMDLKDIISTSKDPAKVAQAREALANRIGRTFTAVMGRDDAGNPKFIGSHDSVSGAYIPYQSEGGASAPTRESALAAVKAGAPKDAVNKRLAAAGLPPI